MESGFELIEVSKSRLSCGACVGEELTASGLRQRFTSIICTIVQLDDNGHHQHNAASCIADDVYFILS
jgi:hypothetical protein